MTKKKTPAPRDMVLDLLKGKSVLKQDIFQITRDTFVLLKEVVQEIAADLGAAMAKVDERVTIQYRDKGEMACELKVAGDVIIFHMHTNVFRLEQSNSLWRNTYLEEDEMRGYFGVINMYNFLSDSFTYNRGNDLGYLVARLFINKDRHYYMQGKRQLGFLYNDLPGAVLDRDHLKALLWSVIIYVIDFDLLTPPYDAVNQVTVSEMNELNANLQLSTGKRLGFRFQADMDDIL
ncbi:MAG: hypothetical protein H6594_05290 [Flavobacteriales bacterium]|nr:hypothetical protein [Flavobacteriales bacterium]